MIPTDDRTVLVSNVQEKVGIDNTTLTLFIQREWIIPYSPDRLDEEDLARIKLIQELRLVFAANDESIALILHLMDQVYFLRRQIRCMPQG